MIDAHYYNKLDIEGFSRMMKDPSYCYKFYWLEEKFEGSNYQYRLGCCNKNGKNKKYVSTWKSGLDQNTDIPNFSSTNEEKKKLIDRMK